MHEIATAMNTISNSRSYRSSTAAAEIMTVLVKIKTIKFMEHKVNSLLYLSKCIIIYPLFVKPIMG